MHPLEPPPSPQPVRLSLVSGVLLCAAVLTACALCFTTPWSALGSGVLTWRLTLFQTLLLSGLAVGALRLLQLCDWRHFALSLIPFGLGICVLPMLCARDEGMSGSILCASFFAFIGFSVLGYFGMSAGDILSRATEMSPRRLALRVALIALPAGLLLAKPCYRLLRSEVSSARAEAAGTAQLQANAAQLRRTVVAPTLDAPLVSGTNVIWCATLQLAWNQLCDLVGGGVSMESEPSVVGQLNRRDIGARDLDPDTFLTVASASGDRALRELPSRLARKFRRAMTPELVPEPVALSPNTIVLYAALFVNLPFAQAFNRLERPFRFGDQPVAAFGTEGDLGGHERARATRRQVKLLDYRNPDDFALGLTTKRSRHQLILAKIPPAETLSQTIQAALARVDTVHANLPSGYKRLVVPIADYDFVRDYPELLNRPLRVKSPLFNAMPLTQARQRVRFKLDERGAILESESSVCAKTAARFIDEMPDLIFDKPFLILLKLSDSPKPYFAMWVDNAEVLASYTLPSRSR